MSDADIPFAEDVDLPPPIPDEQLVPWWDWQDGKRPPGYDGEEPAKLSTKPTTPKETPAVCSVGKRRLTVIGNVKPKRITWLIPDLIPRGVVTGLVAPGGTVKGLFGVHMATILAERGERTLFLCSEDSLEHIIRPRFMAAGCDALLAHALDMETETGGGRNLHFPSEFPQLAAAVQEVGYALVVVDPIASHFDPGIDMAKNNQVRGAVLDPLIRLALEADNAMLPIYHTGKDRGRGALGSVASRMPVASS
jgi:AAA domain